MNFKKNDKEPNIKLREHHVNLWGLNVNDVNVYTGKYLWFIIFVDLKNMLSIDVSIFFKEKSSKTVI